MNWKALALLGMMVVGCGRSDESTTKQQGLEPKVLKGNYHGSFDVQETEGTCDFLQGPHGEMDLKFNTDGQMIPPLPGLGDCSITYPDRDYLEFTCVGQSIMGLSEGNGWFLGDVAYGFGRVNGSHAGCTFVRFEFTLEPKE